MCRRLAICWLLEIGIGSVGLRSGLSELKGETSEIEVPELPRASASTSAPRCESEEKRKDDMYLAFPRAFRKLIISTQRKSNLEKTPDGQGNIIIVVSFIADISGHRYKRREAAWRREQSAGTFDCGVERRAEKETPVPKIATITQSCASTRVVTRHTPARPRGAAYSIPVARCLFLELV
jgi:hypothetical protein